MRELVSYLSVPRNIAEPKQKVALEEVAKQIERALHESGLQSLSDPFLCGHSVSRNLEVDIAGTSGHLFVIGARYDAAPSAVATLIELATQLSRGGVVPKHTLRLVAFSGETGVDVCASRCKVRGEELVGMVSLEAIGGTKPLRVIGNLRSRQLVKQVAKALQPVGAVKQSSLAGLLPGRRTAFAREGWPAVRVTDGGRVVDYARLERVAAPLVDFVR